MSRACLLVAAIALVACVVAGPAAAAVGGGGGGSTTSSTSTFDHRYDLFYGTLTVTKAGEPAPQLTRDAFASELRVSPDAAGKISSALGDDPRIAAGFAGAAPDGGGWFTEVESPAWFRFPNGTSRPESEPSFDAQSEFQARLGSAPDPGAQCTDAVTDTILRGDDFVFGLWTQTFFGPADTFIGEQRSQPYHVAAGATHVNTEVSYLVIDAHRIDRTCVVPNPDAEPAPDPAKACRTEQPTIEGTKKNDKLTGTDGPDVIHAGEGNDNVFGSTGRDKVLGDLGDDLVNGGPTDGDRCDGGEGADATNRGCETKVSIP